MWPGKEAGENWRKDLKAKVRPPPTLKSYLYTSGNTLYLHWGTHSSFNKHLDWTVLSQLFKSFLYSGHWNAFHHSSSIPAGVSLTLFSGVTLNIGPLIAWTCLALGNWSLLSCLQFSIHLQLIFSLHFQTDWGLRFWSRGPLSATNPWGVICSQSHARKLCSWPRRQPGWGHSQKA